MANVITIDRYCIVADQITHWERRGRGPDPRRAHDSEQVVIHLKSGVAVEVDCNSAVKVSDEINSFMLGLDHGNA